MRSIVFILALSAVFPLTAEASSVFDDVQSFQVARAAKLGREKGSVDGVKRVGLNKNAISVGKAQKGSCSAEFFLTGSGECVSICDGTTCSKIDPSCKGKECARYQKYPVGDRCYCY